MRMRRIFRPGKPQPASPPLNTAISRAASNASKKPRGSRGRAPDFCRLFKNAKIPFHAEPRQLKVGDARIRVGGLTAVATLPDYRERGLMTRLLDRCLVCMKEEEYAFSELGGYRRRYNWFGWENGGQEWRLEVYPGRLAKYPRDDTYHAVAYDGRFETLDAIALLHNREQVGLVRNRRQYEMLMRRGGYETWVGEGPEGPAAYVVCQIRGEETRIVNEFGGCAEGLHSIFCHLLDETGVQSFSVLGPRIHPLNDYLFAVSSTWSLRVPRMIKILDLEATMRGFCGQLRQRCQAVGIQQARSVALAIEETEQQVQINLSGDRVGLSAVEPGTPVIRLPELAMVRLLFCPGNGSRLLKREVRFLETLLPLDFFIWPLERV